MPTIEITDAQAAELAKGHSITVGPRVAYIAVHKSGAVYEIEGNPSSPNRWRRIRNGSKNDNTPYNQWNNYAFNFAEAKNYYTIVPVDA